MAKVILDRDIPKLGRTGDVKEVADGFARNYLLPKRLATLYTPGAARSLDNTREVMAKKREVLNHRFFEFKASVEKQELSFTVNVDEKGELFGSIGKGQILKALRAKGIELPKGSRLELGSPLRTLGTFNVPLWVSSDVQTQLRVTLAASAPPSQ